MKRFCARLSAGGLDVLAGDEGGGVSGAWGERARGDDALAGCVVLFRGFLANAGALRAELGLGGAGGEAAIVAHAFRRWGEGVQRRLLGEYALVAFDSRERSALLTHDALGLVPLFYAERPGELLCATDLLDLIPLLADDALDPEYFADYLASGYVSGARTPFAAVRRLLPGMTLRWSPAGAVLRRTWDLAEVGPAARLPRRAYEARLGAYEERLRELLSEGVRSALGTRGATWVSLSGGLDSSTIACLAARERPGTVGAFSLVVPERPAENEEAWMREVVAHCGLPWHPLDISTALPFSELPDGFLGEPSAAVVGAAVRRQRSALLARHGVTTVLTGDGGDAILGTFPGPVPTHLADPLFRGDPFAALRGVRAWGREADDRRSLSYWTARGVLMPALAHLRGHQIASDVPPPAPPWLDGEYARRMGLAERGARRLATRCAAPGAQQTWDTVWIGALSMSARAAALEAHEVRTPLLYRPLVEFMQTVPWELKLRPRCDRYLQRRALKGVLPEGVRRRAGKAIGTWPFVEGLRRSRAWTELLCADPRLVGLGITDRAAWRDAVHQASVGQTYGDRWFLTAVAIEVWLQGLEEFRRAHRAVPRSARRA